MKTRSSMLSRADRVPDRVRDRQTPTAAGAMAAVLGLCLLAVPAGQAAAQEDEEPVVLATYYVCDQNLEEEADGLVESTLGPLFDAQMDAGNLTAWGWLSHNLGDEWRRGVYSVAPTRSDALAARAAVLQASREQHPEAAQRFTEICPTHVDYIWRRVAGSDASGNLAQERASVAMSSYYMCDAAREGMTDEIAALPLGSILNRHVEQGNITSWTFLSHDTGGEFRRLLVIDAVDAEALFTARDRILDEFNEETPTAAQVFSEACWTHDDYLWDIVIARP